MIIDANILLYAVDEASPFQTAASDWLTEALNGDKRVGIPWQTIGAFVRIVTHPRIVSTPLDAPQAWSFIDGWLSAPTVWIPSAGLPTARILATLINTVPLSGNLIPDAQLAALALENGVPVVSADTDFARFQGLTWINPVASP